MNDQDKTKQQLIEELADLRRRVAEQEAQLARCVQAEDDQRQIDNSLPVLVATAGVDGYYTEVNAAFGRILGWTEEESLSRPFIEFIHPDDRPAAVETFERLKSGDTVIDFVDRNVCKDGSYRWINWTVIPLPDRGIVFGIGQDITEKKLADEALRESERRLNTLISNLPGAVFRCTADPDRTVEFLSDGYLSLTGDDPSALIGQPGTRYHELVHPDDLQRELDAIQDAIAQRGQFQVEYRLQTTSGEDKWVWEQGAGVFADSGELLAIEGFTTDITPQKNAELVLQKAHDELEQQVKERTADLRDANRRLITTLESITDGFISLDHQWRHTYANQTAASLLGVTPDELLGKVLWEVHPEAQSLSFFTEFHQAMEEMTPVHFEEFYPDPLNKWYECHGYPSSEGLSVYFRDITERKEAQDALQKERDALDRMLRASDHDRKLINYEIHDGVTQQLLGALMFFEAYSKACHESPKEVEARFDAGLAALRRAYAESRSLMDRTRTPVLDKFGVKSAIADFIDQFGEKPDGPEITYRCEAQFERLEPVLENTIFRVVQEAITNACNHSKSEIVRVSLTQEDEDMTVEVQDSGVGFDPANVEKDRFGLDGIRERTRLLGKDLQIESTPGVGTRIRATFPLVYKDEQAEGE